MGFTHYLYRSSESVNCYSIINTEKYFNSTSIVSNHLEKKIPVFSNNKLYLVNISDENNCNTAVTDIQICYSLDNNTKKKWIEFHVFSSNWAYISKVCHDVDLDDDCDNSSTTNQTICCPHVKTLSKKQSAANML